MLSIGRHSHVPYERSERCSLCSDMSYNLSLYIKTKTYPTHKDIIPAISLWEVVRTPGLRGLKRRALFDWHRIRHSFSVSFSQWKSCLSAKMHLEIDLLADSEDNDYTDNKVFVRAGEPCIWILSLSLYSLLAFIRLYSLQIWINE